MATPPAGIRGISFAVLCIFIDASCGRVGFDTEASIGGDGGSRDDGGLPRIDAGPGLDGGLDAGPAPDGGGDPNCAAVESESPAMCSDGIDNDCDSLFDSADPDCANDSCMIVTTNSDEANGEESAQPPHLGAGLSLREAIELSNTNLGSNCIVFDSAMTITIASTLPALTRVGGLHIDGAQRVHVEASGTIGTAFKIDSGSNTIQGLQISNVEGIPGAAIQIQGGQTTLGPNVVIEDSEIGILVVGAEATITRNHFHNILTQAIQAKAAGTGLQIHFNLFHNNTEALQVQNNVGMLFRHNTLVANGRGVNFQMTSSDATIENNIFVGHAAQALRANGTTFVSLDFNDFFGNATDCDGCTIGPNSIRVDPLLVAPSSEEFQLDSNSPAIDKGVDTGLSPNGDGAPSPYNGVAPDLGSIESP